MSNFFFESLALIGALLYDEYGNSYLNENPWEDPIFQEFMEASKYDPESNPCKPDIFKETYEIIDD